MFFKLLKAPFGLSDPKQNIQLMPGLVCYIHGDDAYSKSSKNKFQPQVSCSSKLKPNEFCTQ